MPGKDKMPARFPEIMPEKILPNHNLLIIYIFLHDGMRKLAVAQFCRLKYM